MRSNCKPFESVCIQTHQHQFEVKKSVHNTFPHDTIQKKSNTTQRHLSIIIFQNNSKSGFIFRIKAQRHDRRELSTYDDISSPIQKPLHCEGELPRHQKNGRTHRRTIKCSQDIKCTHNIPALLVALAAARKRSAFKLSLHAAQRIGLRPKVSEQERIPGEYVCEGARHPLESLHRTTTGHV